eukprot:COSAG01_NODE_1576_length_9855_cov_32.477962_16_plen_626_part_00
MRWASRRGTAPVRSSQPAPALLLLSNAHSRSLPAPTAWLSAASLLTVVLLLLAPHRRGLQRMTAAAADLTPQGVREWAATQLEPQALAPRIRECAPEQPGGARVIEGVLRLAAAGLFDGGWVTERGLAHALWTHGAYADGVTEAEAERGLPVTGRTARGEGRNWYELLGFQRDSCALDGRSDDELWWWKPQRLAGVPLRSSSDLQGDRVVPTLSQLLEWLTSRDRARRVLAAMCYATGAAYDAGALRAFAQFDTPHLLDRWRPLLGALAADVKAPVTAGRGAPRNNPAIKPVAVAVAHLCAFVVMLPLQIYVVNVVKEIRNMAANMAIQLFDVEDGWVMPAHASQPAFTEQEETSSQETTPHETVEPMSLSDDDISHAFTGMTTTMTPDESQASSVLSASPSPSQRAQSRRQWRAQSLSQHVALEDSELAHGQVRLTLVSNTSRKVVTLAPGASGDDPAEMEFMRELGAELHGLRVKPASTTRAGVPAAGLRQYQVEAESSLANGRLDSSIHNLLAGMATGKRMDGAPISTKEATSTRAGTDFLLKAANPRVAGAPGAPGLIGGQADATNAATNFKETLANLGVSTGRTAIRRATTVDGGSECSPHYAQVWRANRCSPCPDATGR